jgi:hypothetical protein
MNKKFKNIDKYTYERSRSRSRSRSCVRSGIIENVSDVLEDIVASDPCTPPSNFDECLKARALLALRLSQALLQGSSNGVPLGEILSWPTGTPIDPDIVCDNCPSLDCRPVCLSIVTLLNCFNAFNSEGGCGGDSNNAGGGCCCTPYYSVQDIKEMENGGLDQDIIDAAKADIECVRVESSSNCSSPSSIFHSDNTGSNCSSYE